MLGPFLVLYDIATIRNPRKMLLATISAPQLHEIKPEVGAFPLEEGAIFFGGGPYRGSYI